MPCSDDTATAVSRPRGPWKKRILLVLGGMTAVAFCAVIRFAWLDGEVNAQQRAPRRFFQRQPAEATATDRREVPARAEVPVAAKTGVPDIVAIVNGEPITREQLADDVVTRYGEGVLESLINKRLITTYCQQHGITVTEQEVSEEIKQIAARFRLPVDHWLKMLQEERHISPDQYANEIIWPMLALRKAANQAITVTPEEIQAAYESQYGPAVEARLIVCYNEEKAKKALEEVKANPGDFGRLAAKWSDDPTSASAHGLVLPIRKHLGNAKIEEVAFSLKPGEFSDIVHVDNQWVILKCEGQIPSRTHLFPLERVRPQIEASVREKKENAQAGQLFEHLKQNVRLIRCYGDAENSKRYPGVAAVVGDFTITMEELRNEAVRRHGVEILEGTISRRILQQHIKQANISVTDEDVSREIERAAEAMGLVDPQTGRVDVARWLDTVSTEQGLSVDRYIQEIVWPSAALKNYVLQTLGAKVEVTEDDIRKGFEANFGPRCICRAIMLNNQRAAQEVWEMARKNPNPIYFGQLAAKYSIDPQSRSLNGEVPPIQKHGGRPTLEAEAFKLKAGELSGIIQINDYFVILFCEGYTKPVTRDLEEVRDEIERDLYEKKLRVEMAKAYNQMLESARIENFLANSRQVPKNTAVQPLSQTPQLEQPGQGGPAAPATTRAGSNVTR